MMNRTPRNALSQECTLDTDAYLDWFVTTTPSIVRGWVGEFQLREQLRRQLLETWERTQSPQWLDVYAESCPVAGAAASDYRLREIEVLPGVAVLAGIHFYGGRVEQPFVDIEAQTRALSDAEILRVSDRLREEFSVFHVRDARWWSGAQHDLRNVKGARNDQRFVVGHLREIGEQPVPALPHSFSLESDPSLECYNDYARIYEDLFRERPDRAAWTRLETRASLASCAEAGGLSRLRDGERVAGVIAARPSVERGVHAWYMVEEVLDAPYRGRGFAPLLQRAFLAGLDRSRSELVSGHIDAANLPSLRTALRCGRIDAGGWVFLS
jgi:hypothetical protein